MINQKRERMKTECEQTQKDKGKEVIINKQNETTEGANSSS